MSNQLTVAPNAQLTSSQRFTEKVLSEFRNGVGEIAVSEFQRRLIQNYFVSIDLALKTAETNRLKKDERSRETTPVKWENVNMELLAVDVVRLARMGLDSAQKNHINFVPYKNNSTGKYDIVSIIGYVGLEHNTKKYALEMPEDIEFQLVYTTDVFKVIRKNVTNNIEAYSLEVVDEFERGEVKGGFAYFKYANPTKNKVMIMSLKDILKRKPKYASVEFWGGEKDVWENKKKTGEKEKIDGWFEEMCLKTIKRAAYNSIALDPQKVDDNYQWLKSREATMVDIEVEAEVEANANTVVLDTVDYSTGEIVSDENIVETESAPVSNVIPDPGF